jgi:hypothetical protein
MTGAVRLYLNEAAVFEVAKRPKKIATVPLPLRATALCLVGPKARFQEINYLVACDAYGGCPPPAARTRTMSERRSVSSARNANANLRARL